MKSQIAVPQEYPMGCGIACVAFLLNRSYQSAEGYFTHPEYALRRGYGCQSIVNALKNGGLDYSYKRIKDENELFLKDKSIVFIERDETYPEGHYLVNSDGPWMDPWINFPNIPREGGFRKKLPGKPAWIIYNN